ncbi:MAG TPA: GNAT family N-acetyltransferase [Polyangiales bacterium]
MDVQLRSAKRRDCEALVGLIGELAAFENLSHQMQVRPSDLEEHLFGEQPVIECLVADRAGKLVGFALFFVSFSTFLGKPGLYLEDLYVQPAERGRGVGTRLMTQLAQFAVARGYGRFEWSVLDWNSKAIAFYEKLGAAVMPEWRICRVSGDALQALGAVP